jgi:DnaJ family protein C protein 17
MDKVKDLDLYLLFDIANDADENTIKKAYRKKALKVHPDKNPDNPKAAEKFHQLSEALTVLTDESARKAYDNLLKARKANEIRNRQLDAKRRKFKDALEAREKVATEQTTDTVLAGNKLAARIEQLRKEGQRQLEEEQERLRQMIHEERTFSSQPIIVDGPAKLKVRWKESSSDASKYDSNTLKRIFSKYGDVGEVIVMASSKKSGSHSGLIEMKSGRAASLAENIERGFDENPLKVKLLVDESGEKQDKKMPHHNNMAQQINVPTNFNDYESLVMRQMRQEQERKRIIKEMKRHDDEEEFVQKSKK